MFIYLNYETLQWSIYIYYDETKQWGLMAIWSQKKKKKKRKKKKKKKEKHYWFNTYKHRNPTDFQI